jgi:hypothetical protein
VRVQRVRWSSYLGGGGVCRHRWHRGDRHNCDEQQCDELSTSHFDTPKLQTLIHEANGELNCYYSFPPRESVNETPLSPSVVYLLVFESYSLFIFSKQQSRLVEEYRVITTPVQQGSMLGPK